MSPERSSCTGKKRKNVSRACDRCRRRKAKCTGESPSCGLCVRRSVTCVYSTVPDKRLSEKISKDAVAELQARVRSLERRAQGLTDSQTPSSRTSTRAHTPADSNRSPSPSPSASTVTSRHQEEEPFETGQLVLSTTGNLHLLPEATFYRPAYVVPEWQHSLQVPTRPGYLARYLPFPIAEAHHRLLVDTAFDTLLSFGPNPFRDKFVAAMNADPDARGPYFSPILHLCILGVGWRNIRDQTILRLYYPYTHRDQHGEEFVNKARDMVLAECVTPHLSNIWALFVMALFYVGVMKDALAGTCFIMGQYSCMDMRLHKRCDIQLAASELGIDGELDVARRDVWGFAHNFSAWWSTFYAQPPLSNWQTADQRPPLILSAHPDPAVRQVSLMSHHHPSLSDLGIEALDCNHMVRLPMTDRIKRVKKIWSKLQKWRSSLPSDIFWPPVPGGPVMHPGNIVTHGMYDTYVILLFRPYIIEFGGAPRLVPEALDRCIAASREIVSQCRYMVEHHTVYRAPLSWQHTIYVCGTTLVLLLSGLPVTEETLSYAQESLEFLRQTLRDFTYVWPAASQTADSLLKLQQDSMAEQVLPAQVLPQDNLEYLLFGQL